MPMTRNGAPDERRRTRPRPAGTPRDLGWDTSTTLPVAIALRLPGRPEAQATVGWAFDATAIASARRPTRRFGSAPVIARRRRVRASMIATTNGSGHSAITPAAMTTAPNTGFGTAAHR